MSKTTKSVSPRSEAGKWLLESVQMEITAYEAAFGDLPRWLLELEREQALALVGSMLRLGLRLPPHDLLRGDMCERERQARLPVRKKPLP